jgi:putative hemolysin
MLSDQFHGEKTREELLPHVAGVPAISALAEKFFRVDKMRELYQRLQKSPEGLGLENLLAAMRVELRVDAADAARIPATGPVVVVANHPFGMLDGAVLAVLLTRARPDVKVMTTFPLGDVPELSRHCIGADPLPGNNGDTNCAEANHLALAEAQDWLQAGGMLALFPAAEVSQWQFPRAAISDPQWSHTAVHLIRHTGAAALPVYFCGRNSMSFHLFGMIHPRLRSAFLLQEFLQQEGRSVEVRVGSEISSDGIASIADDQEATDYLRWRTYLLARRRRAETSRPVAARSKLSLNVQQPVASPEPRESLAEELSQLAEDRCLAHSGDLAVYLVKANETPRLLQEVGRLREETFRGASEGTGKPRDLDRFDRYYWHLLLWHRTKQELVGGYRAGNTSEILAERSVRGLYTSTLFRYHAEVFEKIGPALELGRSFVRPEYQRQYAPLLLLWKGIARLLVAHPETPILFGAVSISNGYNKASREMIYRFFEARMREEQSTGPVDQKMIEPGMIEPRRPFRPAWLRPWDCRAMCHVLRDLEELSEPITDVEADGKGLPILLRQYAKIGGKLLGFNVDRKFANVLDGLVMVDLRRTETVVLERFMGKDGAERFRRYHGLQS